ncbi:MAG: TolC family protein [Pseudomonadota bacterium]
MFSRIVPIVLALVVFQSEAQSQLSQPYTDYRSKLLELFIAAESHHPLAKVRENDLRAAKFRSRHIQAQYRPNLSLQGQLSAARRDAMLQDETDFDDTLTPRSLSVNLSHRLYDGGRRSLSYQQTKTDIVAAGHLEAAEQISIYAEITQQALTLARAQAQLELLQQSNDLIIEREKYIRAAINVGEGARLELNQVKSRKARSEAHLITAQENVLSAKSNILSLTGISIDLSFPPPDFSETRLTLNEAQDLARRFSPSIQVRKAELKSAKYNREIVRRNRLPSLDIVGRAAVSEEVSAVIDQETDLSIGLNLSVPIYSGGISDERLGEENAKRNAARYRLIDEERRSDLQIATLFSRIQSARDRIAAANKGVSAAREALLGAERSRELGISSELIVLDAIDELYSAEQAVINAQFDLYTSYLLMELLTGELISL